MKTAIEPELIEVLKNPQERFLVNILRILKATGAGSWRA